MGNEENDKMGFVKREIRTIEGEIESLQKEINDSYKKYRDQYFELRKIIEDEENHEDELICNPLKINKSREYQTKLNQYKESLSNFQKLEKSNNNEINKKYEKINELKKTILLNEKARDLLDNFEEERRNNLNLVIGIIRDKKIFEQFTNKLSDIMEDKKK
jgi:hypothetical protein